MADVFAVGVDVALRVSPSSCSVCSKQLHVGSSNMAGILHCGGLQAILAVLFCQADL